MQSELISEDSNGMAFEKLGDYYIHKQQKEEALKFYLKGIVKDNNNFSLLKSTLLLQVEFNKFEDASKLSSEALEIFPSQPFLYLANGIANIKLKNITIAVENLELGLDYLFDDPNLEHDFYEQLSIAFTLKGDNKKAKMYTKKALVLKPSN